MFPLSRDADIHALIEAKKGGKHLCLNGRYVDYHSEKCRNDILRRIEDACHWRDHATHQSDSRTYYNGVLKVLRRKLREVEKALLQAAQQQLTETPGRPQMFGRSVDDDNQGARLLKLAGLL
jgi:hypothetical protein